MPEATIVMDGHILDSLLLPKVLDVIIAGGAEYEIEEISIGRTRHDTSHARIRVIAPDEACLTDVVGRCKDHGVQHAA